MTIIRNGVYNHAAKDAMQKNANAHRAARFAPLVDFARKVLPLLGTAEGLSALADRPDEEQLAYGKQLFAAVTPALDAFQKERAARWKRARESLRQAVVAKKTIRLNRLRSRLRVMQSNKEVRQVAAACDSCQHRSRANIRGTVHIHRPTPTNTNTNAQPPSCANAFTVVPDLVGEVYRPHTDFYVETPARSTIDNIKSDKELQQILSNWVTRNQEMETKRNNVNNVKKTHQVGRHRVYTMKNIGDEKDSEISYDYVWEDYIFDTDTNKFRKATEAEKEIECCGVISADIVNCANNPSDTEPAAVSAHEQFSVQFASAVKCMPISKKGKFVPPLLNIDSKREIFDAQFKTVFEKLFGETFPEIKARLLNKKKEVEEAEESPAAAASTSTGVSWTILKRTAVTMAVFAVAKGASIAFSSYILSA